MALFTATMKDVTYCPHLFATLPSIALNYYSNFIFLDVIQPKRERERIFLYTDLIGSLSKVISEDATI